MAGENATELVVTNDTEICNDNRITLNCIVRNSTIIQWSSSFYGAGDQILCQRGDSSIRNTTINNIEMDIFTNYTAAGLNRDSLLSCNVRFLASALPVNQQLSVTCLNVDVEVQSTNSFQITGMSNIREYRILFRRGYVTKHLASLH